MLWLGVNAQPFSFNSVHRSKTIKRIAEKSFDSKKQGTVYYGIIDRIA